MDYIKAFVTGGLLCAAVQILMDKTKLMPGRIMVLLVVCGSILGAIGLYEPYAKWAGSGATVPLLGLGIRFGRACGMELTRMEFWGCLPADSRRVRRGFPGR